MRPATIELGLAPAAAEILLSAGVFLSLFHTTAAVLPFLAAKISRGTALDVACKSVSAAFGASAASAGLYLLLNGGDPEANHPLLQHVFLVVIAYFLYDLYAMYRVYVGKKEDEYLASRKGQQNGNHKSGDEGVLLPNVTVADFCKNNPLLAVHHFLIGAVFTPLMMLRLDHDPGELMIACALIFEASTPFVSLRAILSYFDLKRSRLYLLNGVLMVATFLFCRILVYPAFYAAYASQRGLGFSEALSRTPGHCRVFMLMVLAPQLYWFVIMVKGAVKVMEDRNGVTKKAE